MERAVDIGTPASSGPPRSEVARGVPTLRRYLGAVAIPATCTLLAAAAEGVVSDTDRAMLYLLGAALAGLWLGRGPSVLCAALNIAFLNFFFVEPRYTFAVADGRYLLTFVVMLAVGLIVATLMASVHERTLRAEASERRTAQLHALSRELAAARGRAEIEAIGRRHVTAASGAEPALREELERQVAQALERDALEQAAEAARVAAETEASRNTLLASISHDLRTPLAVITAAGTALADGSLSFDAASRVALATSIATRAREMSELVSNVLDVARLQGGAMPLRLDAEAVDDLVAPAVRAMRERFGDRRVEMRLAPDLPAVHVDAARIAQVLTNLIENAVEHTPAGTPIRVVADRTREAVRIRVEDDGPGLPPGPPSRLFEKFVRGPDAGTGGAGLGLSLCRLIVEAHGGRIHAENAPSGGARFTIELPLAEDRP